MGTDIPAPPSAGDETGRRHAYPQPTTRRAALAGMLAVGVAIGVSELLAGAFRRTPSLLIAIGDFVIDVVPGPVERAAIAVLGSADKPVLLGTIVVVSAVLGVLLGILALRRFALAAVGFVAFAALGSAAALRDPQSNVVAPVVTGIAGALTGIVVLRLLLGGATCAGAPASHGAAWDRRRFLVLAGFAGVAAAGGVISGQLLTGAERLNRIRRAIRLPRPVRRALPPPAGADLEIRGLTPLYVPNAAFYRIDTALTVPQVDPADWSLEIKGRVDRPLRLTYDELMGMPHIEADITLSCVSNEVGGGLVGNARWQGVPLHVLLERAGVQEGATQLVGRSVDGFTAGFPTVTALNVKESMVAVAMNGEPLPLAHGFPARLVVPGLYGYVSATKWLAAIELTRWEDFEGYWVPRGWAREGPVKTQSRIDVPAPSSTVRAGRLPVAGVAWAPTRGIRRVEVRVDGGPWHEARLATALGDDCWRQWVHEWDATPGRHVIAVRATDGDGEVQTDASAPVAPDGATGHHTISVDVRQ